LPVKKICVYPGQMLHTRGKLIGLPRQVLRLDRSQYMLEVAG